MTVRRGTKARSGTAMTAEQLEAVIGEQDRGHAAATPSASRAHDRDGAATSDGPAPAPPLAIIG